MVFSCQSTVDLYGARDNVRKNFYFPSKLRYFVKGSSHGFNMLQTTCRGVDCVRNHKTHLPPNIIWDTIAAKSYGPPCNMAYSQFWPELHQPWKVWVQDVVIINLSPFLCKMTLWSMLCWKTSSALYYPRWISKPSVKKTTINRK